MKDYRSAQNNTGHDVDYQFAWNITGYDDMDSDCCTVIVTPVILGSYKIWTSLISISRKRNKTSKLESQSSIESSDRKDEKLKKIVIKRDSAASGDNKEWRVMLVDISYPYTNQCAAGHSMMYSGVPVLSRTLVLLMTLRRLRCHCCHLAVWFALLWLMVTTMFLCVLHGHVVWQCYNVFCMKSVITWEVFVKMYKCTLVSCQVNAGDCC